MKLTFYLQYFSYDDENFNVDDSYYQDSNDYIKSLEESYNSTKDVIFEAISSGSYLDKNTYKMPFNNSSSVKKEEKYSYTKCEGILLDETMDELNDNTMSILNAIQDVFVGTLKLEHENMEEEFETNWRMFLDSTNKIMKYDTDEDWKFIHKPTKDIYFSFLTNSGEEKYGKLVNCRIIDSTDLYNNVLIIEKLIFIDKL